jgi:Cdc6-like AAA superfamily ATPase
MSGYAHLLPAVQILADAPDEVRIRRLRTDRWIGYARAEAALEQLEDLLSFPPRTRMPNMFLVGPTNNGKTVIVEKFRRIHRPAERSAPESALCMNVLAIQMPASPDEHSFFSAILTALGAGDRINERRLSAKQETIVRLMRAAAVRLLAIDEVHNLLCGSALQQRRFLNLLRWLGNELQIPLVAVGTA